MKTEPLLSMRGITKRFGATQALRGVSFSVCRGQVMALIGENGAGKSTLMKVLSGAHRCDAGTMRLDGRPFEPANPHGARLAGIAMIYQELNLAPDLSVEDNIMLGRETHACGWLDRSDQRQRVRAALDLLGHGELSPGASVGKLSVAAQQLVEIARALALQAKILVFDEPTSSLPRRDVDHLFRVIAKLRGAGIGIIYISHFLEEIREVCDQYTVLRDGCTVGGGTLAGAADADIVTQMVGRSVDALFPRVPHEPGDEILSLRGLSGERMPSDVSLALRRGEILGIFGLVGAGRTELLRLVFGLEPGRGEVRIGNQRPAANPRARTRAGFGLVSEDRKGEGLAQGMSLADNMTLNRLKPYGFAGTLNLRERGRAVRDWMDRLGIRARHPNQEVQELSGGNQQKVAIARILHQDADVLLLDEPARGIDVGTKAEIYRLMGEMAVAGKAIIFVSSYLPELLAVCDRLGVMARGRLCEIHPVGQWTEETILAAAMGGGIEGEGREA